MEQSHTPHGSCPGQTCCVWSDAAEERQSFKTTDPFKLYRNRCNGHHCLYRYYIFCSKSMWFTNFVFISFDPQLEKYYYYLLVLLLTMLSDIVGKRGLCPELHLWNSAAWHCFRHVWTDCPQALQEVAIVLGKLHLGLIGWIWNSM